MLEIVNLYKSFGDVVALDGCNFTVRPGQLVGLLGPNGSGKTTTMRSILSLVAPDSGTVRWAGAAIDAASRLRFGYMPEQRGLYPRMKVASQLVYFGRLHGLSKEAATTATRLWLDRLGLSSRSESRLEELSHGNQQRAQLAAALVHDPTLLVLDEPFSGLDPIGVEAMIAILTEHAAAGAAVVFSSHQLDLVEDLCEDVVILARGKVVLSGPVRELRSQQLGHRYLDIEVSPAPHDWGDVASAHQIVARGRGSIRLRVDADTELEPIIRSVARLGQIREFSFTPPDLSEVFREVVGS
jgi:ABC-2 type transport system ATP-binding protein